jgi:hypothetical protein
MTANQPRPDGCDDLDFSPRIRFGEVISQEYEEIDARRRAAGGAVPQAKGRPPRIAGLALSGGGVRSATFNLGLLQALAAAGKLKLFDYFSTVSGGGYVGGWWSAWLSRPERLKDDIFPPPEDIDSERDDRRAQKEEEGSRTGVDRPQINDSAINAAEDPIHHLRLFSNVMTPRKGLLSGDTWRAIAVIGRNIVLTWIILLPMLLAAIMIGQAWFTLAASDPMNLKARLIKALIVPGFLFAGSVVCATFWMVFSRRWKTLGDKLASALSLLAFFALTFLVLVILGVSAENQAKVAIVICVWIILVLGVLIFWTFKHDAKLRDVDFWRNRFVQLQTRTLSYSVFTLAIFLFAGFGDRLFDYLVFGVNSLAERAGGWGALALTAVSTTYTMLKTAPTGGGDNKKSNTNPPLLQRIAFAVAPVSFLLLLGVVLSWVGRSLYMTVSGSLDLLPLVAYGALVSAFLFLTFALYEFRPQQRWKNLAVVAVWVAIVVAAWSGKPGLNDNNLAFAGVTTLWLLAAALTFRAILRKRLWIFLYALVLAAAALWIPIKILHVAAGAQALDNIVFFRFVIAGVISTLVLLVFELLQGRGANTRSIALTVIACTIFVLAGEAAGAANGEKALAIVGLIATILGWVLALGWLADPNLLTMHGFYKARLVRAYMGASNERRAQAKDSDITDAVPGDDILLTQLRNTEQGAPYHLINTMLNLVGGSDLSTQARASDSFLMSKRFCGSMRTGYRRTSEYACGSISLGTAVAVSGAAASPSMGAQSPSAALSALMTLFNIRLGYWAPTPSLSYWRSGAARLWPVYTLQELISQTTDLLPYCNLTDGGHYENTGVYSLIQRGCNLIVVGECGADPEASLDDLGNMIRKVRIDFAAEVILDIDKFRTDPRAHVLIGEIHYDSDHAAAIGLPANERVGTIVVVKPNLAGDEPVDVRQYGFLNHDFPQQNTFDLWYDEAQFESYRRLGQESGQIAVATGKIV